MKKTPVKDSDSVQDRDSKEQEKEKQKEKTMEANKDDKEIKNCKEENRNDNHGKENKRKKSEKHRSSSSRKRHSRHHRRSRSRSSSKGKGSHSRRRSKSKSKGKDEKDKNKDKNKNNDKNDGNNMAIDGMMKSLNLEKQNGNGSNDSNEKIKDNTNDIDKQNEKNAGSKKAKEKSKGKTLMKGKTKSKLKNQASVVPFPLEWQKKYNDYEKKIFEYYLQFPPLFNVFENIVDNDETKEELSQFGKEMKLYHQEKMRKEKLEEVQDNSSEQNNHLSQATSFDFDRYIGLVGKMIEQRTDSLSMASRYVQDCLIKCVLARQNEKEKESENDNDANPERQSLGNIVTLSVCRNLIIKSSERKVYGIKRKGDLNEEWIDVVQIEKDIKATLMRNKGTTNENRKKEKENENDNNENGNGDDNSNSNKNSNNSNNNNDNNNENIGNKCVKWSECRVLIWEARDYKCYLPSSVISQIKTISKQRASVSASMRKYEPFVRKFDFLSTKRNVKTSDKIQQLQSVNDKITSWEVKQKLISKQKIEKEKLRQEKEQEKLVKKQKRELEKQQKQQKQKEIQEKKQRERQEREKQRKEKAQEKLKNKQNKQNSKNEENSNKKDSTNVAISTPTKSKTNSSKKSQKSMSKFMNNFFKKTRMLFLLLIVAFCCKIWCWLHVLSNIFCFFIRISNETGWNAVKIVV